MKQFTLERAQSLVKRELGINAASLTAPANMNGNPAFPWYGMSSGNQRIALYTKDVLDTRLIALSVTFENGTTDVTQYFYADTLEFADKATKARKWEDIEDLTEGVDIGMRLRRLQQDALAAYREHTTHIGALSAQAKKVWLEKMECIRSQDFEKAAALRDTERALRQEPNGEKAPAAPTPETMQTPVPIPFRPSAGIPRTG